MALRRGLKAVPAIPRLAVAMVAAVALLLPSAPALAVSGQGIEISPPLVELTANPGQTVTANIQIRNVTNIPIITSGSADDFGAGGEEGEPKLLLNEKEAGPYSLKFWVNDVPDLRLVPREVKTASIKIAVPQNAEPGGHYGVIRFTAQPADLNEQTSGVSLSASIGALILMKVNGKVKESASIVEFYSASHGYKKWFFEKGPIDFVERIKDDGNVHLKPSGKIDIYNTFGKKVNTINVNDNPPHNVLPGSVRKFQQTLSRKGLFGRYHAKLSLVYGSQNKPLNASLVFWVIPWRLILLGLLALVIAVLLGRQGIKRYNRRIIKKANAKK